jgi:hypothetical protein
VQLWSHPEPVLTSYRDGGWSAEALADEFAPELRSALRSVGEEFPPIPPEFQRPAS